MPRFGSLRLLFSFLDANPFQVPSLRRRPLLLNHQVVIKPAFEPRRPPLALQPRLFLAGQDRTLLARIIDREILAHLQEQHRHTPVGLACPFRLFDQVELATPRERLPIDGVEILRRTGRRSISFEVGQEERLPRLRVSGARRPQAFLPLEILHRRLRLRSILAVDNTGIMP